MIPSTVILLLAWLFTYVTKNNHLPIYILLGIWIAFIGGSGLLFLIRPYFESMIVNEEDNYGVYKIDLEKFNPEQSRWQHDNFELEINRDHYLRLYKLKPERHIFDSVKYTFDEDALNKRVRLETDSTQHHIIAENPTLYRKPFNHFYYVFESSKYGNMFFEKD